MPFPRTIRLGTLALSLCAGGLVAQDSSEYDFGMVTIGDVGNPAYPGYLGFLLAGRGLVDYEYRIGRIEHQRS